MAFFIKLAQNVDTQSLVFFRNFLSFFFLSVFALSKKVKMRSIHKKKHIIRAIAALGALYCFFYASKQISLLEVILFANTIPLFMPLIIWIVIRSKIPIRRVFFILIGFVGVSFILKPTLQFQWVYLIGLGIGVFGAIGLFSLRMLTKIEAQERIMFYFLGILTVFSLIPLIIRQPKMDYGWDWIYVFLLGMTSLFYQLTLTKAYTHIPASQASTFMYLSILFAGILDWLYWGSIPDIYSVIGSILVILGGLAVMLDPGKNSFRKLFFKKK